MRDKKGRFVKGHKGYKPWLGKKRGPLSEGHKRKTSMALIGKKKTEEHRRNISLSKKGKKNPAYKNGMTKDSHGYWLVLRPNHPNANINGRVALHRLIVEERLGRYLKKEEHIHHVDFDINNNDFENLYIASNKKHQGLHGKLNKLIGKLVKEGIITFNRTKGRYEKK